MEKNKKPGDLTKGSSPKTTPQLTEQELSKVSGGIKGESVDVKHKDE